MLAKSLKFAIVFAVVLTFFGGTAMADNRGRGSHHPNKWDRSYQKHQAYKRNEHHIRHHPAVRAPHRHITYRVSKPHPLAPRIVFLGGLPVPVPPPPHVVLGFITGHR